MAVPFGIDLVAEPVAASVVRDRVSSWLRELGWPAEHAYDVVLAVNEATANVIDHIDLGHPPGPVWRTGQTEERNMARVVMQAVVSVDGYIAYPDDTVGPLFDWYFNGDTELRARASGWMFHVSRTSAEYVQPIWDAIKVTVIGRHLFDTTNGWDGKPAAGDELVVVTHRPLPDRWVADHPDAPFHTADSVEAGIALATELAGDGLVCVTAGDLGGQAFSAGLVDEIAMDVVPVVLGEGVRFFGSHAGTVLLNDPDQVIQGDRVLHLHYTVKC